MVSFANPLRNAVRKRLKACLIKGSNSACGEYQSCARPRMRRSNTAGNDSVTQGDPRSSPMSSAHLSVLHVSHMPASPPRFGAQARMHGLMTQLARRHDLTAVALVDGSLDVEECRRAMQDYCREVVLV